MWKREEMNPVEVSGRTRISKRKGKSELDEEDMEESETLLENSKLEDDEEKSLDMKHIG